MLPRLNKHASAVKNSIGKGVDKMFDKICLILLIIGGLNWGSIGLFRFDIVAWLFGGQGSILARIVYTIVALAGVWCISLLFRDTESHDNDIDMPITGGAD